MIERAGDRGDVERYEQLRGHALVGEPSGWRLGLAVLQTRGTAAWLRAGRSIAVPVQRPPPSMPVGGDELVGALATMAMAAAGGERR